MMEEAEAAAALGVIQTKIPNPVDALRAAARGELAASQVLKPRQPAAVCLKRKAEEQAPKKRGTGGRDGRAVKCATTAPPYSPEAVQAFVEALDAWHFEHSGQHMPVRSSFISPCRAPRTFLPRRGLKPRHSPRNLL